MDVSTVETIKLYREIEKEIKDSILAKIDSGTNLLKVAGVTFVQGALGYTFQYKFSINGTPFTGTTTVSRESMELASLATGTYGLIVEKLTEAFKSQVSVFVGPVK